MNVENKVKGKQGNSRGITLVALVVTIVILIILATVSISALFGENGLIKRAQEARNHQSNAIAMEQGEMEKLAAEYANVIAGVTSWRNITVDNIYQVCIGMNSTEDNVYGLSADDNIVDPHMMKNMEWGAVAYLSKSQYGKETEEVWINNNSNYLTGQAGSSVSASESASTNGYTTTNGQKASTTGNVYGVYDMSGGAKEYIAAYINTSSAAGYAASLVNNAPIQHKDVYTDTYSNASSKYGDAVYETSDGDEYMAWYADFVYSEFNTYSLFTRGGDYGEVGDAGVFALGTSTGYCNSRYGFRSVIVVL